LVDGPLLTKALRAFYNVCNVLSTTNGSKFPPYDESILTQTMRGSLGGEYLTVALIFITTNDYEGSLTTLRLAEMLQNIHNYPLVQNDMVEGNVSVMLSQNTLSYVIN